MTLQPHQQRVVEEKNALLMGRGVAYDKRKPMLQQYALNWRLEHSMGLLK